MQPIYTQLQLEIKSLAQIRQIASDLGAKPIGDGRCNQSWIKGVLKRQAAIEPAQPQRAEIMFTDELCTPWAIIVDKKKIAAFPTWAQAHRYCQNRKLAIANFDDQLSIEAMSAQSEFEEYLEEQVSEEAIASSVAPDAVIILNETIYESIDPISLDYVMSWRVINRGRVLGIMSMSHACFWQVSGYSALFGTPYQCVAFLIENQQAIA